MNQNQGLVDRFSQEAFVGCTVAYPGRSGSSCWITTGTVVALLPATGSRPAKVKLNGGSRGGNQRQLGPRTVKWSQEFICLDRAVRDTGGL